MSLATRCPACYTVFRVVQDQLRVSEGWVRCGRCAEVFNALEHMVEVARPAPPSEPARPAQPHAEAPAAAAPETPDLSDQPPGPMAEAELYDPVLHGSLETASAAPADEPPQPFGAAPHEPIWAAQAQAPESAAARVEVEAGQAAEVPAEGPAEDPADGAAIDAVGRAGYATDPGPQHTAMEEATAVESMLAVRPGDPDEAEASVSPTLPESMATQPALEGPSLPAPAADADRGDRTDAATMPSFLRQAERAARWRRPAVRRALVLVAFLATIGLAGQIALTYRDLIAARWPVARAGLEPLCQAIGCIIEQPRWLDAVVVESTGLTRLEGNTYRLQISLRNRSPMTLALPTIDLMLTDNQGRLVARRALTAVELGAGAKALAAHAELPLQATLALGDKASPAVSGYTIEVFYP